VLEDLDFYAGDVRGSGVWFAPVYQLDEGIVLKVGMMINIVDRVGRTPGRLYQS